MTWVWTGSLGGCLHSTAVPRFGATRTMAMFLWVEKGAKMKFEMLACAGHSVELPMCCIRGHPLLSQALAPELLK